MTNTKYRVTFNLPSFFLTMIREKANIEHVTDSIALERILEEYSTLKSKYGELQEREQRQELEQRQDLRSYEVKREIDA